MAQAISRLLAPVGYNEFVAEHWGRDFLLNKGPSDRFDDLFQWSSVEKILSTQRFDFPRLRVVKKGKVIPSSQYMVAKQDRRGNPYMTHVSQAILRELEAGAMLHIAAVNDAWEPLGRFAAELELDINARVQVNLHAALARSRGFAVHWDGHDVFVIQIAGKKTWRLFGFTESAPLAVPPDQKSNPPQTIAHEVVLEAGDMLYLPRGYWHAAEALDDVSLHLTVAAQYPTGVDVLSWLITKLEENDVVRKNAPFLELGINSSGVSSVHYLAELKSVLDNGLRPEMMEVYMKEYRATLGQTNHLKLDGGRHADS